MQALRCWLLFGAAQCKPHGRLQEEDRVVIIRFGHDWDQTCMQMDEVCLALHAPRMVSLLQSSQSGQLSLHQASSSDGSAQILASCADRLKNFAGAHLHAVLHPAALHPACFPAVLVCTGARR